MPPSATSTRVPSPTGARPPSDLIPGLKLGRRLARGGFAEIWEAEQRSLERKVAVKIMRNELLGLDEMVRLFEQESRVLARLNHPNVVQVIDRGACERGPYFVMEYVEGETLQSLLAARDLDRDRALSILMQAARGLAYAHLNRVVHRDVKPANILVRHDGQVKIGDFGIAAVRAVAHDEPVRESKKSTALGTRAFMAPEQRTSFDRVTPSADVYSLGVILHRIVTGELPDGSGRPLVGSEVSSPLRSVIEKSLRSRPGERYSNAGQFREALVNVLDGRHLDESVRGAAASTLGGTGRFELLDVIRQDDRRSVYLVRKGGEGGEKIVVKRYVRDKDALRTVRALTRIEHPNIVRIFAVGERDDAFIMLMEHLSGGDLRERLVQPHAWRWAAEVGRDVATALACVHEQGIVHGNLRPSNIMFDETGKVRVTDFGLPEHYRGDAAQMNWYAAPEEESAEARDLYALGAILFEMLFALQPTADHRSRLLDEREDGAPARLKQIIRRLLASLPERVDSAQQVARELAELLDSDAERVRQERLAEQAAVDAEKLARSRAGAPRHASHVPSLVALAGLVLLWLLERRGVQDWLVTLASGW
ncbi:MAG: protein kinase [Acidobacteriota bacterium]|nr:protein kinase [Acidobacteriota bacterium]